MDRICWALKYKAPDLVVTLCINLEDFIYESRRKMSLRLLDTACINKTLRNAWFLPANHCGAREIFALSFLFFSNSVWLATQLHSYGLAWRISVAEAYNGLDHYSLEAQMVLKDERL